MKIGLFFGSFNPVHNGHLIIAACMAEFTDLEQVWMVVSPHNPMKAVNDLLQDYHRLELVKKGVGDHRKIKVTDVEFKMPKPNYTAHTLRHLSEKFPQHQFALILGADLLESFVKWRDYEKILERYELYVYPRAGTAGGELLNHPQVKKIKAPLLEISATFIREAIRNKKDVRYMLPESVWDYIEEMGFYSK